MRLGRVQRDVIAYLKACGPLGGYIGQTTQAKEFSGYDLEQVQKAIERLLHRRILRKEGVRYVITT